MTSFSKSWLTPAKSGEGPKGHGIHTIMRKNDYLRERARGSGFAKDVHWRGWVIWFSFLILIIFERVPFFIVGVPFSGV